MNCVRCQQPIQDGDRVIANERRTFIFKPANVQDPEIFDENGKRINLAAVKSPDEMRQLRQDHTRTTVATIFAVFGKEPLPESAFHVRHDYCDVQRTGSASGNPQVAAKHAIRFSRGTTPRGRVPGGQH